MQLPIKVFLLPSFNDQRRVCDASIGGNSTIKSNLSGWNKLTIETVTNLNGAAITSGDQVKRKCSALA